MGCGGSKDEVATGNTVSTRHLLSNKSDSVDPIDNGSVAVTDTAERNPDSELSPPTLEANGAVPSAIEEGKVISKDSPDLYFSSRKDDEAVTHKVQSEGAEYYSPPREPKGDKVEAEIDGTKDENGLASEGGEKIKAEIDGVMAENELVSKGGEEVSPKEEEGKAKEEVSTDLNEAISVEEKKPEESNVENKNLDEGEIGTNDSSPDSV